MAGRQAKQSRVIRARREGARSNGVEESRGLGGRDVGLLVACAVMATFSGVLSRIDAGPITPFVVSAIALALLATVVGRAVDALADRFGAGATGVIQSALSNLPMLFVCFFALKAGLHEVVRSAIVGSILSSVLLVLGLAFVAGGLKNGPQRFSPDRSRTLALMISLAVFALAIPSLTFALHTPASGHEESLSRITAGVLLALFLLSLPAAVAKDTVEERRNQRRAKAEAARVDRWPFPLALGMLAAAASTAAFVSNWFVASLSPAIDAFHISDTFAGLVIVAIASNSVMNVVGIQLALKDMADHTLSVVLQSPLQIALVVAPILVLSAPLLGTTFTLVLSPILLVALLFSALVTFLAVFDGESTWFEGATLIGLYVLLAAGVWWG